MNAHLPATYLPDFCRGRAILHLLLISQVVAVLLVLASARGEFILGPRIVVVSLYLHWITLLSAGALCALRQRVAHWPVAWVSTIAVVILVGITAGVSEMAYQLGRVLRWAYFSDTPDHLAFVARNCLISAIVAVVLLRYFYVLHAWQRQVQASAEARFEALQATIRPHFLFNSLNSVAALIPTRPAEAEALIEDLAELLRAILRRHEPWARLADEIELGRTYLRIEQLRLGERLQVDWQIEAGLDDARIPLLSLQPLLENAVLHGIERLPEGGRLQVRIGREGGRLTLRVSNPLGPDAREAPGNRLAQDNIRQRLGLLYDGRASLHTQRQSGEYHAELSVPL